MPKSYFMAACLGVAGLFTTTARAQTDFRPGYLVRPAGDTVRGLVDYRNARRNSLVCQFRPTADAPTQVLKPADVQGYGIGGEAAYRSLPTPLPDSAGRPRPPRLFFLEILAAGPPAALYQRRVLVEEPHYYVQKAPGAPLKELVITRQTLVQGERTYYQDMPTFRGVLNEQFSDCPGVLLSLGKTEFKPTSLIAAVQRYNECRQPGTVVTRPYKSAQWVGFEVLLGAQASQLTFSGFYSPVNGNFRASLTPEAGVGMFISSRALRDKLQLRLEAHYAPQHYEDAYPFVSNNGSGSPFLSPTSYQSRFQADYLRVPLLLRYLPFAGRVRPFLEAGGTVSPLLHLTQESRAYTPATATYGAWEPAYDPSIIRHLEYGWLAGVGVQVAGPAGRPVSVLGRLESSNGFLETTVNYNTATRYYLLLAIGLRKQQ